MTNKEQEKKLLAAAYKRLERLKLRDCFDPIDLDSRPTDKQSEILSDISKYRHRYIRAGNQCLAEGTLVMTPKGPVPIEDLKIGDTVYDELGQEISVTKTHVNGVKEVADMTARNKPLVACTADHKWWTNIYKNKSAKLDCTKKVVAAEQEHNCRIQRQVVYAPLGDKEEPHAYTIGALLGDGCSKQSRKEIRISSIDNKIPLKVSEILGGSTVDRNHEKVVDIEIIKTWNRESLLNFVAGIIDTDGSIYPTKDHLYLSVEVQAKSVIDALEYVFLALWQVPMNRSVDNRDKYVNGPIHTIYTRNSNYVRLVLEELDKYLVSPQKKYREEYKTIGGNRSNIYEQKLTWGANRRFVKTYDITVDGENNVYMLANGLITSNSGKTQQGAREITWIFNEEHPYWERPKEWGDENLLLIVVGRTTKQIEHTIWPKIKNLLYPGTYTEKRSGGALQSVVNTENGNTIIFASHHSVSEAQEKLQSFVAHYIWIDEMPGAYELFDEAHQRITARRGYFLATFTPKVQNDSIRQYVDAQENNPIAKVYRLRKLDNPIYKGREQEILDETIGYSEAYRNAVLNGDWLRSEDSVYDFDQGRMVVDNLPSHYSSAWRHVEAVDPALKSKFGFILLAEDPETCNWYVVKAEYVSGIFIPRQMVEEIQKKTKGYNITRRVSDTEPWYVNTATDMRVSPVYFTVSEKTQRKGELMKNLQTALGTKLFIASWCTDLIDEFNSCRWSDTASDKIVNAQTYHLIDSLQYGIDVLPSPTVVRMPLNRDDALRQNHEIRLNQKAQEQKTPKMQGHRKTFRIKKAGTLWR